MFATGIQVRPTFESCGYYLSNEQVDECRVSFRQSGETQWHPAYTPVYDSIKSEYRGSIVRLKENTEYRVKAEFYSGTQKIREEQTAFTTWNPHPAILKTVDISAFYDQAQQAYLINDVNGSNEGWIRIHSIQPLNLLHTEAEAAIVVKNSQFVILENITLIGGGKHGMEVDDSSSDIRIQNCDISGWGRVSEMQDSTGVYLDTDHTLINYDAGIRLKRTKNIVVERCYIHDSKAKTNPWQGTVEYGPCKGRTWSFTHPAGCTGIYICMLQGGAVIRFNDIIGSQEHRYNDPIESGYNGDIAGGFHRDSDIYGNVMAFGQDDGIELDGGQCNVRMFNNRIEQTFCGISTAPNRQGPSYIFNNVIWNLGNEAGIASVAVKNGGGTEYTRGRHFLFNNTMMVEKNVMSSIGYGKGKQRALYYATTRNNIFVSGTCPETPGVSETIGKGQSIADIYRIPENDFDYDLLGNTLVEKGSIFAIDGSEQHAVYAMPDFTDCIHGVFTLQGGKAIDSGTVIPNFSDVYQGQAPDMGAFEQGVSSLLPIRPVDISSDKYCVYLKEGVSETITLTIGKIGKNTSFQIRKSADMDWLNVEIESNKLQPDTQVKLILNAVKTEKRQAGMMLVRLENGLSVPVTVFVE
ncbi:hypothetical protein FACS189413_03040 [Bacteroidia bacterium]|nr:hypothetical protein FACS189413_03040 [Bacteroidia bacterium]